MARFIVERFLGMIVTLFVVSIMVFVITERRPGDNADRFALRKFPGLGITVTEADIQAIRVELGLDRPAVERYFTWISNMVLRGDFGMAYAFETPVTRVIRDRGWLTLGLLLATLLITCLVAIPVGTFAAVRRGAASDYALTVVSYLGLE
jgi:peptide/nickel transport system permease protein